MTSGEVRSQKWIDKIEELVHRAESISDPNARRVTVELLQAVLDFHAAALERVLDVTARSGPLGESIIEQIATDDLTSSMLLLHNLHPDDLETRVNRAVQKLHDVFVSLGARLSLSAIEPGTVWLHFDSARSWPSSPVKTSIENAIFQAAPEIERVVIEGLKETPAADFVPLSDLLTASQLSGSGI